MRTRGKADQISAELGGVLLAVFVVMLVVGSGKQQEKAQESRFVLLRIEFNPNGIEEVEPVLQIGSQIATWDIIAEQGGEDRRVFFRIRTDRESSCVVQLPDATRSCQVTTESGTREYHAGSRTITISGE